MRNYRAMKPEKLERCLRELHAGEGDAYARVVNAGENHFEHFLKAAEAGREKGLGALVDELIDDASEAGARGERHPGAGAPNFVGAHLAQAADIDKVPYGWRIEPKLDGWWLQVYVHGDGTVKLWARSGDDLTARLPFIKRSAELLLPSRTRLIGELVPNDGRQGSRFVHSVIRSVAKDPSAVASSDLHFVAFDLLAVNGMDFMAQPFSARRSRLEWLFEATALATDNHLHIIGQSEEDTAAAAYEWAVDGGYEGIIAKSPDAPYLPGQRGRGLIKVKAKHTVDVVVMEVTKGAGEYETQGLSGGIWFGQHSDGGLLLRRGSVSSGFTFAQRRDMLAAPELYVGRVMEIGHMGSDAGGFRHPRFIRWRDDKTLADVHWHDR